MMEKLGQELLRQRIKLMEKSDPQKFELISLSVRNDDTAQFWLSKIKASAKLSALKLNA
jgi:hypothetical protein